MTKEKMADFAKKNMAMLFFLLLFFYNALATPHFLSIITIRNLINQSTSLILVALGATLIISAGCIDISLGSGFCFGAVIFGMLVRETGSIVLALVASILAAAIVGTISGTLVGRYNIQTMICTMAMMYILRSISKAITKCAVVRFGTSATKKFVTLRFFDMIPVQLFIAAAATLLIYVIAKHSRLGIYLEACGDNRIAARTSGLRVETYIVIAYMIGNILAFMGGIYDACVVSSVDPTKLGLEFEFRAIAAAVIGGTPISGGRPKVMGTVFGVFILKLINMMIQMNNVSPEWSYVITAGIIIAAILVQNFNQIRNKK